MRSLLFVLAALIVPATLLAAPHGARAGTNFTISRGFAGDYSSGGSGCCNSCGDTGCCECDCCDPGPKWTVRAGAMYLHRQRPTSQTLLVDGTGVDPILDASDLGFGFNPGWELNVIRRLNCDWAIEARYFDISDWSSNASVLGTGGSGVLYENGDNLGVFGPNAVTDLRYTSSLENVELNLRRRANDWLTLIGGFRYVNIDDRFQTRTEDTAGFNAIVFQQITGGGNDLFGGQLGADACLWQRGCFRVDALGKAGLYLNDADNQLAAQSDFFNFDTTSGGGNTQVAFIGELALNATCQLTCHWAVRAGYQLLWVEGVALASEQPIVNPTPIDAAATTIDSSDGLFYHGFTGGLEFTW